MSQYGRDGMYGWGCKKCGGRFDLDRPSGRCSAHYELCRKCFCEKLLEDYKGANILQKILCFIPYILMLIAIAIITAKI